MKTFPMKRMLTMWLCGIVIMTVSAQQDTRQKLSSWLRQALEQPQQNAHRAEPTSEEPEKQALVFVQFATEVSDEQLAAYHCRRYAQLDDIAIVLLPVSQLDSLSKHHIVLRMEANQRSHVTMDTVPKVTDLLPAYEKTLEHDAYTGRGVVVGVMDVGFDLTHPNFYNDETLSQYRIGAMWDQLAPWDEHSNLPVGRSYVTQEELLAKGCSTDGSTMGHGTHTLGIAAGSGYDSPYRGVAYESELCLVSNAVSEDTAYISTADYYKYSTAADALGFKYIFDYAERQQKPCVISFSEGYSPNDTQEDSLYAAFLEKLTGPGRIIVASAGNENVEMNYAEKPYGTEAAGAFVRAFRKDVLYRLKVEGRMELQLAAYDKATGAHLQTLAFPMAAVSKDSVFTDSLFVGDSKVTVSLARYRSGSTPRDSVYQLLLQAPVSFDELAEIAVVMVGAESHAELYGTSFYALKNMSGLDSRCTAACYGHNVLAPGCFLAPICVGATLHRKGYVNASGKYRTVGDVVTGQLAYYSSTGPAMNRLEKPDVTAPGTNVISSFSSYYYETHPDATEQHVAYSEHGGRKYPWMAESGTSMSTPVVAGTIALWLQAKPSLTREDIMGVLNRTCRHPEEAIYPNVNYGCGEIDGFRGLQDVLELTGIRDIREQATGAVRLKVSGNCLQVHFPTVLHAAVSVTVCSVSGLSCCRVTLKPGQQEYEIPLTRMASGIYVIQLKGEHYMTTSTTCLPAA